MDPDLAPGGRIALLGMPAQTHPINTTTVVTKDLEVHAVLGGAANYATTVQTIATGAINAADLIDTTYDPPTSVRHVGNSPQPDAAGRKSYCASRPPLSRTRRRRPPRCTA